MKMNLAKKMIVYFLLVVAVAAAGFSYTIWKVNDVAKLVDNANSEALPRLLKTNRINNNVSDEIGYIRGYHITKNPQMLSDYKKAADENTNIEDELIKVSVTEEGKRLITEVKALDDKYSEIAGNKYIPLVQNGKEDEARQVMINELEPITKSLNKKMDEYQDLRNKQITNSLNQAVDHAHQARMVAMLAAVLAAIMGMVIGFFAAGSISRPVNKLAIVARKVAGGDLTEQVEVNSQDEIGQLAVAFNTMVLQLKDLIKHVTVNAEQVAASSEELTANAEQSAQATNQVALSITDVAAGANEQMKVANEASTVVETMSAGIQQIAANANQVAAQSANAADTAKNGGKEVEMAVKQMNQIEDTVNSSAQVVAKLGERSKEIGEIVDTIAGIAGQTNLLALNAAIEAARAGEQGKGFAVVAEEVRKLAEQSQEAAKKIAELIGGIQGDTDKAVIAMNEGTQEVKTGAKVVNAAGIAFKEIMDVIDQVSDQVKEISAAIQQMATGSQQIVGSVKKIDDLSKKSAGESQNVSAATEEQLASMEEIATASQTLSQLAQELQTAVTKFRV
jgi:methyl-accepting chemotaxis protein